MADYSDLGFQPAPAAVNPHADLGFTPAAAAKGSAGKPAPTQPDAIQQPTEGFWGGAWKGVKNVVQGASDLVNPTKILDNAAGLATGYAREKAAAKDAASKGRTSEQVGHTIAAYLPGVGPAAAQIAETAGGTEPQYDKYGNVIRPGQAPNLAGATGEAIGTFGVPELPRAAGVVADVFKAAPKEAPPPPAPTPTGPPPEVALSRSGTVPGDLAPPPPPAPAPGATPGAKLPGKVGRFLAKRIPGVGTALDIADMAQDVADMRRGGQSAPAPPTGTPQGTGWTNAPPPAPTAATAPPKLTGPAASRTPLGLFDFSQEAPPRPQNPPPTADNVAPPPPPPRPQTPPATADVPPPPPPPEAQTPPPTAELPGEVSTPAQAAEGPAATASTPPPTPREVANRTAKAQRFAQAMLQNGFSSVDATQIPMELASDTQIQKGVMPGWANIAAQLGEKPPSPQTVAEIVQQMAEFERTQPAVARNPKALAIAEQLRQSMNPDNGAPPSNVVTMPQTTATKPRGRAGSQRGSFSNRETGPHGPIAREFAGKPRAALQWVRDQKNGFAAGAIPHPELGSIGLAYGEAGDAANNFEGGFGVSHIDAAHPGYLDQNIEALSSLPVVERIVDAQGNPNAAVLFDGKNRAVVSHTWKGQPTETWLLTSYERAAPTTSVSVGGAKPPGGGPGAGPTPPATGAQ